jgi:hypothetical protein
VRAHDFDTEVCGDLTCSGKSDYDVHMRPKFNIYIYVYDNYNSFGKIDMMNTKRSTFEW